VPQFITFDDGFPNSYSFAVDFSALPESVAFDATLVVEQSTSGPVITTTGF
jgi:hypothetical protein